MNNPQQWLMALKRAASVLSTTIGCAGMLSVPGLSYFLYYTVIVGGSGTIVVQVATLVLFLVVASSLLIVAGRWYWIGKERVANTNVLLALCFGLLAFVLLVAIPIQSGAW